MLSKHEIRTIAPGRGHRGPRAHPAAGDLFGDSVSISGDVAVVGAPCDDSSKGAAHVFRFNGTSWSEEAKLTASDGAAVDYFGSAVAVSGPVVLVGSYCDDDKGAQSGSAYVFRYSDSSWSQEKKLTDSDGAAGDFFGYAVAISGPVALVGAWSDDVGANSNAGSARVFRYDADSEQWDTGTKLTASDAGADDNFGHYVSISGHVAIVGARKEDENGSNAGAAYLYRWDDSDWDDQEKLTATDRANYDYFGTAVSISGPVVLVGAYCDDDEGAQSGSAYVFRYDADTEEWDDGTKLTDGDGAASDYFGYAVALSGPVAVVGAWSDDVGANANAGSARAFRYDADTEAWDTGTKLTASDAGADDNFGHSVSISGHVVIVGARKEDENGSNSGAAYLYRWDGTDWDDQAKLTASDAAAGDYYGVSVAVSGHTALVGAEYDVSNAGSAYFYAGVDGGLLEQNWTLSQTGNWTANEKNHVEQSRKHTDGKANEIDEIEGDDTHIAHDRAGNMVKAPIFERDRMIIGHHVYVYDSWNRLAKITTDAETPLTIAEMAYDALGRRIEKKITNSGDWNCTYHFYYNGSSMIETRNGSDQVLKQHVWGELYVDELVQIGLNDDPTHETEGPSSDQCLVETYYYAAHDANYNVTNLFESDGDLAERYSYTPYGRRQVYKPADANDTFGTEAIAHSQPHGACPDLIGSLCDIGHQGLMHDKEFGLIYNRARYLHPLLGRFLQRDPLGYVAGMSLYEYLSGAPVGRVDPFGQDDFFWTRVSLNIMDDDRERKKRAAEFRGHTRGALADVKRQIRSKILAKLRRELDRRKWEKFAREWSKRRGFGNESRRRKAALEARIAKKVARLEEQRKECCTIKEFFKKYPDAPYGFKPSRQNATIKPKGYVDPGPPDVEQLIKRSWMGAVMDVATKVATGVGTTDGQPSGEGRWRPEDPLGGRRNALYRARTEDEFNKEVGRMGAFRRRLERPAKAQAWREQQNNLQLDRIRDDVSRTPTKTAGRGSGAAHLASAGANALSEGLLGFKEAIFRGDPNGRWWNLERVVNANTNMPIAATEFADVAKALKDWCNIDVDRLDPNR